MKDLFERIIENKGPLGKWASVAEGYFVFPKLEGPISNRMTFNGKEVITWSVNDYLGLANQPEVREVDAAAAANMVQRTPWGSYDVGSYRLARTVGKRIGRICQ